MKVLAVLLVALTIASSQAVGEEESSAVIIDFQTLLGRKRCLGTLLNSNWGMTSAGCCLGAVSAEVNYVRDLSIKTSVYGAALIRHDIYDACLFPVDFNPPPTISYPSLYDGPIQAGQEVTSVTWGTQSGVRVEVMRTVTCPPIIANTQIMFCTDHCENNFGASAQVNGQIVGIVSWGPPCPQERNYSGIYAKVSSFRNFIEMHMD